MVDENLKGSVFASVEVTLRIDFHSPWSPGETMEQIVKVAQRDGRNIAEKLVAVGKPASAKMCVLDVDPNVTFRFVEEKKR